MTTSDVLPPLYARWMDDLLGSPIPAETNATCSDCAMVPADTNEPGFNPRTKCCTFVPDMWNFLVGAALLDEHADSARGRASVEARIDSNIGVTPLGLRRSVAYQERYDNSSGLFGHSETLLCPHYIDEQGGLCGVWRHRESTCTTWFCKFVRGAVGREFWRNLHQLLRSAEESVSAWCVLELGMDDRALSALYPPPPRQPRTDDRSATWGAWRGREREFYRECAKLVATLAWPDVVRLSGAELALHARLVRVAYERMMDDATPEYPMATLVQITPRERGRVRLATYSDMDALELPSIVAELLPAFDGRPLDDALAEIRRRHSVVVEPSLVRKLTDFGVLRDARATTR